MVEGLKVGETVAAVARGEALWVDFGFMLPDASLNVGCGADIDRSVFVVHHDVDVALTHGLDL